MISRSSKWNAQAPASAMRAQARVLLLSLLLAVSAASARAGDLVDLEGSFMKDSRTLDEGLQSTLRQVRAPGTPGTAVGAVRTSDVQALERSLESARQQAQRLLALPSAPPADGSSFLPADLKKVVAEQYLNLLANTITLRIALGWSHDTAWRDSLALRIPKARISDVADVGVIELGRRGEPRAAVIIDRGSDGNADPVTIRHSDTYVEGLELGILSDKTNSEESLLVLVKYLTIRQLQDNLELTQGLQGRTPSISTAMPAELVQALPSLGLTESVYRERRSLLKTAAFGAALPRAIIERAAKMPVFADTATVGAMVDVIARAGSPSASATASLRQDLTGPFTTVLKEAQSAKLEECIQDELRSYDSAAIERGSEEGTRQLRSAIAGGIANTQMRKIIEMMSTGQIQLAAPDARTVLETIARRQQQIEASLSSSLLSETIAAAKAGATREMTIAPREKLIDEITLGSKETSAALKGLQDGTLIDFPALFTALHGKIDALMLDPNRTTRPRLQRWLKELESAPTWTEARIRYTALFANELNPAALADGQVEKARALSIILSEGVVPQLELPTVISAEYRQRLIDSIVADIRSDWQTFIKIGDLFGLNWSWRSYQTEPAASRFLTESSLTDAYQATLKNRVRDRYPVIAELVETGEVRTITYRDGTKRTEKVRRPLANIVAEITANDTMSEADFDRVNGLIDQALAKIESRIRKDITTVAKASSFKDIEPLLQSELMLGSLMGFFPEFKTTYVRTLEKLMRPSTAELILHEDIGTYLTAGFGALILLHIGQRWIKPLAPLCGAIAEGVAPLMNGYIRSATILSMGNAAYMGNQLWNASRSTSMIGDFYAATPAAAWTGGYFGIGEVEASRSSFRTSLAWYLGTLAMDTYFMYWPMMKEFIPYFRGSPGTAIGGWGPSDFRDFYGSSLKSDFLTDVDAFKVMGVKPGNWSEINSTTLGRRMAEKGTTMQTKRVIELAYARLKAKIASGRTWIVIDAIEDGTMVRSRSSAETALVRVLKKSRWGGSIQ